MPADDLHHAASPPPAFQPLQADDPTEVAGYRLYARLGAGGMGRVYLSYTPGGRPVALKVVRPEFAEDPEFRRRFTREVANAQRIHGLYTAQVIDAGTEADTPWLVTAYVPGPSLQQVAREHGGLPVRTVLLLLGGIAEALQAIHSVDVVHRDLKPANVMVAADGPRVIDFGIARAADTTALTGTGVRIGSPAYMAPEQAQGRPVTPATDVFALGALAAYVAGGVQPFGEGPETAVLYRVVHEPPELDAVPAELRALLERCLAKSPEDRPTPAEIIELVRNRPEIGGQLRFADDWLPAPVATEIIRRSDLPRTLPTPTVLDSVPSLGTPTPAAVPPPPLSEMPTARAQYPEQTVPIAGAAPPLAPPQAKAKGVSWKTLVTIAVVVALGGSLAGVLLTRHDTSTTSGSDVAQAPAAAKSPVASTTAPAPTAPATAPTSAATGAPTSAAAGAASAGASSAGGALSAPGSVGGGSAPATAGSYTPVVNKVELTIPASLYASQAYQVDLAGGKTAPAVTAPKWALALTHQSPTGGVSADSFRAAGFDLSDFAVLTDPSSTPAQCNAAIDTQPRADVGFAQVNGGRLLCIRDRTANSIAIATIETADVQTGEVKLSLSTWQRSS
ncbi:serine/threonine-protein kinase [Kitasatospora sp. NPDC059722]|uniref:serine/threonine-protein kinase n=1 Tax=unclassified Kitasatospora TaxID=2633591 RepID=UPI00364BCDB0